ncbi:hypothetical protein AA0114_g12831 [Alternaria tenuissima]|uniref:Uncharacterized protein n=1 Tax=Alternaria tenuissima TaxID=119927 RepID=A0A4Q4M077_9PLEO|nr:hypothetical protein AA0114_g12831 [Alternaria tenuissima]
MYPLSAAVLAPYQTLLARRRRPILCQNITTNRAIPLDRLPPRMNSITCITLGMFVPIAATNGASESIAVGNALRTPILEAGLVHTPTAT